MVNESIHSSYFCQLRYTEGWYIFSYNLPIHSTHHQQDFDSPFFFPLKQEYPTPSFQPLGYVVLINGYCIITFEISIGFCKRAKTNMSFQLSYTSSPLNCITFLCRGAQKINLSTQISRLINENAYGIIYQYSKLMPKQ